MSAQKQASKALRSFAAKDCPLLFVSTATKQQLPSKCCGMRRRTPSPRRDLAGGVAAAQPPLPPGAPTAAAQRWAPPQPPRLWWSLLQGSAGFRLPAAEGLGPNSAALPLACQAIMMAWSAGVRRSRARLGVVADRRRNSDLLCPEASLCGFGTRTAVLR